MASNGVTIVVSENALLEIGDVVSLGGSAKIRCCNHIKIGDGTGIVEECQVFDSNFHHMMDTETNEIYPANGVIEIGNLCWIGNRTTISKGTILPNYTIVASNSLVNKSFSKYGGTYPIIGGTPATLISKGKVRIYNIEEEAILFKSLRDSPNYIFQSNYDYSITTGLLWRKKTFNLMRRLF